MAAKRYPLPKRFSAALSEKAYANLRALNAEYGLGNNYILTVLLENLDDPPAPLQLGLAGSIEFGPELGKCLQLAELCQVEA